MATGTLRTVTLLQPLRLVFGAGCLRDCSEHLARRGVRHPLLVSSPPVVGLAQPLIDALRASGAEVSIIADIAAESTVDMFTRCLAAANAEPVDCVIGFGGGSALDAAKLLAALHRSGRAVKAFFGIGLLPGRLELVARQLGGRSDFAIFMGTALLSVRALRAGYDGLVPSSGNVAPELWQRRYAHACTQEWDAAGALQRRLDALARVFQRDRTLGQSLAALKAMMEIRGLCGPAMLPPLRACDAAEREIVRRELAAHDREYTRPTAVAS